MRQLRAFASILVVLALLVGPNLPAGAQPNVVTLRYATSLSEDSAYYKGAVALAQDAWEDAHGATLVDRSGNVERTAATGGKPLVLFIVIAAIALGALAPTARRSGASKTDWL